MLQADEPSVNKCSHFLWSMLPSAGIQVHFLHFRAVSVSMLIWLQRKQKCIFPNMDYSKSIIGALGHLTKLLHIIFIGGTTPWGQWQYTKHYQDGKSLFAVQASEKTKFEGRSKRTVSTVGLAMVLPYWLVKVFVSNWYLRHTKTQSSDSLMNFLSFVYVFSPVSGVGWQQEVGKEEADRRKSREETSGRAAENYWAQTRANRWGMGAHQNCYWSTCGHQCTRKPLEAEKEISGKGCSLIRCS